MSEKEQMALQLFFDGIQAHIKEFKLYMKNEIKEDTIEKSHVDRFLKDRKSTRLNSSHWS